MGAIFAGGTCQLTAARNSTITVEIGPTGSTQTLSISSSTGTVSNSTMWSWPTLSYLRIRPSGVCNVSGYSLSSYNITYTLIDTTTSETYNRSRLGVTGDVSLDAEGMNIENMTITAVYSSITPSTASALLSVSDSIAGEVSWDGTNYSTQALTNYAAGAAFTAYARANDGYEFVKWTQSDGTLYQDTNPATGHTPSPLAAIHLVAVFRAVHTGFLRVADSSGNFNVATVKVYSAETGSWITATVKKWDATNNKWILN